MEGLWFTERQTKGLALSCEVKSTLHTEETPFQKLMLVDTVEFGRMLTLDGIIQTTVRDEFFYHEMIALVPMYTHPSPQNVLVVGGGDGGTIREVVKHPAVKKAVLAEIDKRVIEVSKQYLPEISCALDDPRVQIRIEDGIKHVNEHKNTYDVIIVDSTDPIGPAVELFSPQFYRAVSEALKEGGIFVAQTESPFFNRELLNKVYNYIKDIFPVTRLYLTTVPTYPGGLWSFTMGSKKYDPLRADLSNIPVPETRYYTSEIHKAAFNLPPFVREVIGES